MWIWDRLPYLSGCVDSPKGIRDTYQSVHEYWGLKGIVPESPKVTCRSHPFPILSVIYIHPQHLDLHKCCGLSLVQPWDSSQSERLCSGVLQPPEVKNNRQKFYPGVVVLAKGAPEIINGHLNSEFAASHLGLLREQCGGWWVFNNHWIGCLLLH